MKVRSIEPRRHSQRSVTKTPKSYAPPRVRNTRKKNIPLQRANSCPIIVDPNRNRHSAPASISQSQETRILQALDPVVPKRVYCFVCHKSALDSHLRCSACPKVFHSRCLGKANRFGSDGKCHECRPTLLNTPLDPQINREVLRKLLQFVFAKLEAISSSSDLKEWPRRYEDYTSTVMDLHILEDKMYHKKYTRPAQLLADIKLMQHNSIVVFGAQSEEAFEAKRLFREARNLTQDIEECYLCFEIAHAHKEDSFFIHVCDKNHPLIWAQLKSYPFWPAKCLKVIENEAYVRFFGTHDKSKIPLESCYLLSKEHPSGKNIRSANFKNAMEELECYIKNWKRCFVDFQYYPHKTPFDMNADHIYKESQPRFDLEDQNPQAQNPHYQSPHSQSPHSQSPHSQSPHAQSPHAQNQRLAVESSPSLPQVDNPCDSDDDCRIVDVPPVICRYQSVRTGFMPMSSHPQFGDLCTMATVTSLSNLQQAEVDSPMDNLSEEESTTIADVGRQVNNVLRVVKQSHEQLNEKLDRRLPEPSGFSASLPEQTLLAIQQRLEKEFEMEVRDVKDVDRALAMLKRQDWCTFCLERAPFRCCSINYCSPKCRENHQCNPK